MSAPVTAPRLRGPDERSAGEEHHSRPLRVLLTNTVLLNSGVAAMAIATIATLRRAFGPDTDITVYEERPAAAAKYYPELQLRQQLWSRATWSLRVPFGRLRQWINGPLGRFSRARFRRGLDWWCSGRRLLAALLLTRQERRDLAAYRNADLVVSTGGTYLVDEYDIEPRIHDFELTLRLGRPLVLFTQSMGPFRDDALRPRLVAVLEAARLILLRDPASLAHLRGIGVQNPNVHVVPDSVFALEDPVALARRFAARRPNERLRVAVSLRDWPYFKHATQAAGMAGYLEAVAAAVTMLVRRRGAQVTFLSTCQGVPEYRYDDAQVADRVVARLEPDVRAACAVDRDFHAPTDMPAILTAYDLTIATRFHMAVLSLLAGTPVIAIAYKFMTSELLACLGAPGWLCDIETMEAETFTTQVERCVEQRATVAEQMGRGVLARSELAIAVADLLRNTLG